jgi:hypothetical protein
MEFMNDPIIRSAQEVKAVTIETHGLVYHKQGD